MALGFSMGFGRVAALAQTAPDIVLPPQHSFDKVVELARANAASAARVPPNALSGPFVGLSEEAYRAIRPRPESQIWAGQQRGFTMDLLPPGFYYDRQVRISVVSGGMAQSLEFALDRFDFDPSQFDPAKPLAPIDPDMHMGYAGFRVRQALNRPDVLDEFLVFQGASYFRAVARDQRYGLSARGLAIATGSARGEEFPYFTDFWVIEPDANATSLVIQALLDSPSICGAYQFTVHPGDATVMEVKANLFPRVEIGEVGIACLTSMFYFDPSRRSSIDDYRQAVHDSGGLQIVTGNNERIWRPLANPAQLQVSAFGDTDPKGFGLMQRHRDFSEFGDAVARYDRRPSAWVEPVGHWGPGAVILVEIPTTNEFNDNIVAFWRPRAPLAAGSQIELGYRLHWTGESPDVAPIARVVSTRSGRALRDDRRLFAIDFDMSGVPFDGLMVDLSTNSGKLDQPQIQRLPGGTTARVVFHFNPDGGESAELRLALRGADAMPVSETWLYRWTAP